MLHRPLPAHPFPVTDMPTVRAPRFLPLFLACACLCALAQAHAAAQPHAHASAPTPAPEIRRDPHPPQAVGVEHTLRVIPEACAYLRGVYTGDPQLPYRYGAKKTAPGCQPRAQLVDPSTVRPSVAAGWILNDIIRVPDAACAARTAVVRVWRKPVAQHMPLDPRGTPRIYLEDAKHQAEAGRLAALPQYVAVLAMEGAGCAAPAAPTSPRPQG